MSDVSDNSYAGGISFHPLVVGNEDSIFDPAGGLQFDLPMAALQTAQNNSLNFTTAATGMNYSFLAGVIGAGNSGLSAAVNQSTGLNLAAINAGYGIGTQNVQLGAQIDDNAFDATEFVASTQASLSQYLSDNATKVALGSQSSQLAATTTTAKQSTIGTLIKGLTGGIFGSL